MSREFFNDRRKSPQTPARYQQLAGQVAKPDSSPLAARESASRAAKAPTGGVAALHVSPAASGRLPWTMLGLVAIGLAVLLGLGLVLWPSSDTSNEGRVVGPTSASAQRHSNARPSSAPTASPTAQPTGPDHGHAHQEETPAGIAALSREQLLARGDEHARARRWRNAANDFAAAINAHPDEHWHWFRAATLWAWMEDQSIYRQHCAEMLRRFGETTDPMIAERTAKACLLATQPVADMKSVVRLADQAVAATDSKLYPYFLLARGLAHYRAGEFDQAIDRTTKCISPDPAAVGLNVPAFLVAAMSHHRLGQATEARKALDQAREFMGQDWFPKLDSGELADAWWHDWLICQILHREAEGLIEGKKAP